MRWDDRFGALLLNQVDKGFAGITAVGNDALELQISNQVRGLGDVMALATGQTHAQRIAQAIDADVDFRAETARAAAQRLGGLSAFLLGGARGAGMSPHGRAVQDQVSQIRVARKVRQHPRPNPALLPTRKALVDAVPRAEGFRQQAPLAAATRDPHERLNKAPDFTFVAAIEVLLAAQELQDFCPGCV